MPALYESRRKETYILICALCEESDSHSLIRIFIVRILDSKDAENKTDPRKLF